jgi:hypothetical protein
MKMLILSFIVLIISVKIIKKNKINLAIFSFFCFIFIIISDIYIVSDYFTWKWIDESVIYHLSYWIEWAWLKSDIYIIIIWVLLLILSLIIPILTYKLLKKKKNNNIKSNNIRNIIAIIFLILSFTIHPFTKNILELNWYVIINNNISVQF